MTKSNNLKGIDISKLKRKELREKVIYVRTTESISNWMTKNKISPSKLFNQCAETLMENNETSATSTKK